MPTNTTPNINYDPAMNGVTGGVGRTPPSGGIWVASTSYTGAGGAIVRPTVPNGLQYINNGATGTTGVTQPTWPLIIGNTVVDGGVTWTCYSECALPTGLPDLTVPLNGDTGVPQGIVAALGMTDNWLADIWTALSSKLVPNSSYATQGGIGGAGSAGANVGYPFVGSQPALGLGFTSGTPNFAQIAGVGIGAGPKFTTQTFAVSFTATVGAAGDANVTGIQIPCTLANQAHAQIQATLIGGTFVGVVIQQAELSSTSTCSVNLFNGGGSGSGAQTWTVCFTVVGGDY